MCTYVLMFAEARGGCEGRQAKCMCVEGEEEAMEGKKCACGGLDGDGFVCVCVCVCVYVCVHACRQTGERESE